jgi:predicted metal-binding membrane protein
MNLTTVTESRTTVLSGHLITTIAALTATLGVAAACWVFTIDQARGMDMGVATRLGSLDFFAASWISMMAAMMLPGAIPAVLQRSRGGGVFTAPVFAGAYVTIWAIVGIAVYALYRPHGTVAAGVVVIAAGVYELTPIKRHFRLRCRDQGHSGFVFGLDCVGSSIGLMAILVVVGVMSVAWMAVIAVVIVAQKILPTRGVIDIPLAFAIVGLGILILADPSTIPGLIPPTVSTPMM